ncbi:MAG: hypothetical protein IJI15_06160 [Atopobiaceae bacterium]|nr:hypothetical protein [Atopobiaceae bacterium]
MAAIPSILGAALGIGCGLLFLLAMKRQSMAWGLGAVIAAFAAISIALLIVRSVAREAVVPFGVPAVLAFLVVAVCAVLARRKGEM